MYDDQVKAFFRSVLRCPAAKWFDSLETEEMWDEIETKFIAEFTDGKKQYGFRIEAGMWKESLT